MNTRNMLLVGSMAVIMACSSAVYAADTPMVAARRGGISVSAPKAPAVTKPATTKGAGTNTTQKATSSNSQKTQPSSQANTGTNRTAANGTSSSRWGSAMRNIGLFAGGMFLGSMLSSLLGWGSMGFLSDILGIFMNIILFWSLLQPSVGSGVKFVEIRRLDVTRMLTAEDMKRLCVKRNVVTVVLSM